MMSSSKASVLASFLFFQQAGANPMCVWNQAYYEHYKEDTYSEILQGAQNCYTLVDPFNGEMETDTFNKIAALKNNGNQVGCYMSTGTCENWRNDYADITNFCVDAPWDEWGGEYFVYDVDGMLPYMKARIDQMAAWGCDYVEFDNMDWCTDQDYRAEYGQVPGQEFPTQTECADYNIAMCNHARSQGVKCMAKNTGYETNSQWYAGGDIMDALTMESYRYEFQWWAEGHMQGFLDNNKPVIIVHYDARTNNNQKSCDAVLEDYQEIYNSDKISFICSAKPEKRYIHYNVAPVNPTDEPTESPSAEPSNSPTNAPVTPSTDPFDVFPNDLNTQTGHQSTDQSIDVLSTHELYGTTDNWNTYIELGKETGSNTNAYKGIFFFPVPTDKDLSTYNSLKLTVNYYGPGDDGYNVDTRWQFQIRRYDPSASKWKWTTLGNSGSMQDWVWSLVEFPLPDTYAENGGLVNTVDGSNRVKIRVRTVGDNNDVADIDYLKLSFA